MGGTWEDIEAGTHCCFKAFNALGVSEAFEPATHSALPRDIRQLLHKHPERTIHPLPPQIVRKPMTTLAPPLELTWDDMSTDGVAAETCERYGGRNDIGDMTKVLGRWAL